MRKILILVTALLSRLATKPRFKPAKALDQKQATLDTLRKFIKQYPNDQELGAQIRKAYRP